MDLEKRRLADQLLERALELGASERRSFIKRECAGDEELESFVLRLVELARDSPEEPIGETLWLASTHQLARELVDGHEAWTVVSRDARIGPYRVLREIGRGGMGVVYLGRRSDGHFDQTVALKLLPRGGETPDALDRFQRERQILARLVHPNIAHLLDGGVTAEGVPYFAMEYVEGSRIDRYCDERGLSLDERLRLFLVATRAVDFANSRLIAHGDIKPNNLRVTEAGDVKLLDFGIARLVAVDDPDATLTLTRRMTPEYASPEQVRGQPVGIASDVYQLGLLLYELMTGRRAQPVADATPVVLERAVCQNEPPSPSATWGVADAEHRARLRSTTPSAVRRQLRGDLDNIVMKALRKEPERRYRSAGHLLDDIERHQKRMPVLARPDSWAYRTRKFVSRHSVAVGAGIALALLLIAYAATITFQSRRLEKERDRTRLEAVKATQVKDFLLRMVTADNPSLSGLAQPTATDLLEESIRAVRASPSLDPLVRAELLSAMGETFRKLDRYDEARSAFSEAEALRGAQLPTGHLDRTLGEFERGLMAWEVGSHEEARFLFESVIERRRQALGGADDLITIRASGLLATVLYNLGEYDRAIVTMRDAISRRERTPGEGLPFLPRMWANLGFMLSGYGDLDDGEAALRQAIDLARAGGAPFHTLSGLQSNLAETLRLAGRYHEARQVVERAIEIRWQFHSVEHSASTQLLLRRIEILVDGGWSGEAEAGLAELEEILSGVEGGPERYPARIGRVRAGIAAARGDVATAETILRELVGREPPLGRGARTYARDCLDLASLLLRRSDPEASSWLERADAILRAHVLPSHPDRVLLRRLVDEPVASPDVVELGR